VSSDGDGDEDDSDKPVTKQMKDGDGEPHQQRSSDGFHFISNILLIIDQMDWITGKAYTRYETTNSPMEHIRK